MLYVQRQMKTAEDFDQDAHCFTWDFNDVKNKNSVVWVR
jgi:hypothetical protein